MNMRKIIEWFKSLFKRKEEVKLGKCPEFMTKEQQVELAKCGVKVEEIPAPEEPQPEIQSVKKSKKRGRPRKKKKVEQTTNPQQA